MRPITFQVPRTDGQIVERTGYHTTVPGLLISAHTSRCPQHNSTCWRVTHARSGRVAAPFCFASPEGALALAEQLAQLGPWTIGEEAALRRMALPVAQRAVIRWGHELAGWRCGHRVQGPLGIDNGVIA